MTRLRFGRDQISLYLEQMGRLSKLKLIVDIADTVNGIYDAYVERKRAAADDDKDRKIRDLETELARLKEKP
jgi:hypothetical protein